MERVTSMQNEHVSQANYPSPETIIYQTSIHEKTHTRNLPPVQKKPLSSYDANSSLLANIFHLGTVYENTQEAFDDRCIRVERIDTCIQLESI